MIIIIALYAMLGYWATGKTTHANKIIISSRPGEMFFQRTMMGICLGWLLIPVALIRVIFGI